MLNKYLQRFLREEDGPTSMEYAMMLGLIIVAMIAAIAAVGGTTLSIWESNASQVNDAISNPGS